MQSGEATLKSILRIVNDRYEKKANFSFGPLDGLQRMLYSFSKGDGSITAKDLVTALSEIMIDISVEQAIRIMKEVMGTSDTQLLGKPFTVSVISK